MNRSSPEDVSLKDFQEHIARMYGRKDAERGAEATFLWLMEEIGELAAGLRSGTKQELALEFADVIAWLTTIANVKGIDLSQAIWDKYGTGCPGCKVSPCQCDDAEKP